MSDVVRGAMTARMATANETTRGTILTRVSKISDMETPTVCGLGKETLYRTSRVLDGFFVLASDNHPSELLYGRSAYGVCSLGCRSVVGPPVNLDDNFLIQDGKVDNGPDPE
jgi:hypothetical protein